jgi:hypothetical protein
VTGQRQFASLGAIWWQRLTICISADLNFAAWSALLTGGSDVGYILTAGRADVRQLRDVRR